MGVMAVATVRAAAAESGGQSMAREKAIAARLNQAIADFVVKLNRSGMPPDSARRLPEILRLARYYETAAELATEAAAARGEGETPLREAEEFRYAALALLDLCGDIAGSTETTRIAMARETVESAYQNLKARLLEAGAQEFLPVNTMDAQLRAASSLRRALDQVAKAANMPAEPRRHHASSRTEDGGGMAP